MPNEFTEAQRAELLRLVEGLKRANLATTALDASDADLRMLAGEAAALAEKLNGFATRTDDTWPFAPFSSNPIELPFSPVSGRYNVTSPDAAVSTEGSEPTRVVARVRFSKLYEGPPSFVHGGWIAAMFDQVLGVANHANRVGGLTASLTVQYRRPTPLHAELRFEGWPEKVEERKVLTLGRCLLGDEVLTECEGVFVRMNPERARKIFGAKR